MRPILRVPPAPATYISALAPFEVLELVSTSNGEVSMTDITPAEWLGDPPPPKSLLSVISAWSGGFKPRAGSKMYVHGGGHGDSANNGVYVYDFSGTTQPVGWSIAYISAVADVNSSNSVYNDGAPTSVHTYDGTVHASHNDTLYRFGGAHYPDSGFTNDSWKFAGSTWTQLADFPGSNNQPITVYDAATAKIFVCCTGQFDGRFFNCGTEAWSASKNTTGFVGNEPFAAYDPTRGQGLISCSDGMRSFVIDFSAETITISAELTSDVGFINAGAASLVYDAVRDCYWAFGGDQASAGWTSLYELDPVTFSGTQHLLTGDAISVITQIGSFGRFVLMANAIGLVADHQSPAYVIRLP